MNATFFAAKTQLNISTCNLSECVSVVKTEFLPTCIYMCSFAFTCFKSWAAPKTSSFLFLKTTLSFPPCHTQAHPGPAIASESKISSSIARRLLIKFRDNSECHILCVSFYWWRQEIERHIPKNIFWIILLIFCILIMRQTLEFWKRNSRFW